MRVRGVSVRGSAAIVVWLAMLCLPTAALADFYAPPSPLPPGRPGDVIRSESATAQLAPGVPLPAKAWTVLYRSTTATGQPTAVSATVLVPTAAWTGPGPRPLLGYAIGTQGLASTCAPSLQLASGTEYEASLIDEALSKGWALALTDYPGLGTPGLHPYVVGRALGPAVLDSMRAALRLPADGLSPHAPLAIYGYSEGGGAAGWALELQPSYAPDLKLAGGAVGAPPANFNAEYRYLNGGRFEFLIMYTALGMNSAYPQLHLDRYLNSTGVAFANEMKASCIEQAVAEGQLAPTDISAFVTSNPINRPDWQAAFTRNDLGSIAPRTPVILGAGKQDEVMDYATAGPGLYHQWCALGANVEFDDIQPGIEHVADAPPFATTAFAFLADRLSGKPLTRAGDCVAAGSKPRPVPRCTAALRVRIPAGVRHVTVRIGGRRVRFHRRGRTLVLAQRGRSGAVRLTVTGTKRHRRRYHARRIVRRHCR